MRQIARHGQDRRYHHVRVGVNSRLDTLQAAILLPKLDVFEDEILRRQTVAETYSRLLQGSSVGVIPFVESYNMSVFAQYTLCVEDRDQFQQKLKEGYSNGCSLPIPLNRQPAVADGSVSLPIGDNVAEQVVSLPMHPYLTVEHQEQIVASFMEDHG